MTTASNDSADPIVQRLRALAIDSPDLKDAAQVYEAILPPLRDADLHVSMVSMTQGQARAKLETGVPLLHECGLAFDEGALRELMILLARAVEKPGKKNHAGQIRLALEENKLDISSLLPHIAAGDSRPVASAAQNLGLDPGLLMILAQNALKPALREWCRQLTPLANDIPWHKPPCFVCGSVATLGELRDNERSKHLPCGSCGADWQVHRLQCIYCGNEDHETLRYFYSDSRLENMRIEVCDACNRYLKIISIFPPTQAEQLPIEDLATVHLDYIALARGYSRNSLLNRKTDKPPF